jgi:hypothetical protein
VSDELYWATAELYAATGMPELAEALHQMPLHAAALSRRLIGLARRHQAAFGKGVVDAPPDARTLRGGRREVVADRNWTRLPTAPADDREERLLYPPSTAATLNLDR